LVAAVLEAYDRCDTLDSIEGGAEFKAWLKAGVVNGFGIGASTGLQHARRSQGDSCVFLTSFETRKRAGETEPWTTLAKQGYH
jgi:hypothetical protein